jgi:hypothetical protein
MKTLTILISLLPASLAFAAETEPAPADAAEPPEAEPGGKFSLLGRECKAEEAELETTPGSPPLDVDDPGTPGCNGWEINIVTSGEFGRATEWETPLFDINYGIGDNIQLKFEIPYQISRLDGMSTSGFGRTELGIKYRFYDDESRGRSIAIYPQLEFATPGMASSDGDGGVGTLTKLPVLFSTKLGQTAKGDVMLTANAAYNISTELGTEHYASASVGVGFPLLSKVAMMIEASTEQAFSKNAEHVREGFFKANLGLFGPITDHLLWFGAIGQTFGSSDEGDASHPCAVAGIRILAGGP